MPFVPIVTVEFSAETAQELRAVVLRSCNLALGAGRCASRDDSSVPSGSSWIATVRLDPAQPSVLRIDLRDAAPQSTRTCFTRDLSFDGTEPLLHRWSTAGVVVAALVISAESSAQRDETLALTQNQNRATDVPPTRDVPPTTPTQSARPSQSAPSIRVARPIEKPSTPERDLRVDIGGLVGPSLKNGDVRWGGLVRPSLELGHALLAWTTLSLASADEAVKSFWWSGAVGLGFVTTAVNRRLYVEGRLGFKGERVSFEVSKEGVTDSTSKVRLGGVAGLDLTLGLSRPLALWLSGEAELLEPSLDVNVGGKKQGRLDALGGSLALGFRLRFSVPSR